MAIWLYGYMAIYYQYVILRWTFYCGGQEDAEVRFRTSKPGQFSEGLRVLRSANITILCYSIRH